MKLSILDLVPVSEGQSPADALAASLELATLADELGYTRLWYAEHHNTAAVAASSTAVLIGHALDRTTRLRVGSGGIMLPNHAPLRVAEDFGTLAQLHPGRVDLGLGRAPGTDQVTARALARSSAEPQEFLRNVTALSAWFRSGRVGGIRAGVAEGTAVPMWILGSSDAGATLAGRLGIPYSFASHFAPDMLERAIAIYREEFNPDAPTAEIEQPYVQVGVNVLAHETPGEAEHQFTTTQKMFLAMRRAGGRRALPAPGPLDGEDPILLQLMDQMLRVQAVGTPDVVARRLEELREVTGADELITVTYTHDPEVRRGSLRLVADALLG
ncbi:LLM class flavin-dependent oxidoreductase [uncultured Tessaracoccus sp.]|uniref:LLM class flavin-dependent oxidoreductase n=1 Tax=uncultured Tessaracoccus sp. TaxID=905023 RepID=UPI0025E8AA2A|nr:LLM class flavin-dependent oxidoreductase [uncultured Tessaracoccus sp.]